MLRSKSQFHYFDLHPRQYVRKEHITIILQQCVVFHDYHFVEGGLWHGTNPSGIVCWDCRPEGFLFKCYVCSFVDAIFGLFRNASTKCEAQTPPGQFLVVYKTCISHLLQIQDMPQPRSIIELGYEALNDWFLHSICSNFQVLQPQIAGKWQRGWLEFRPANVVWHSRHGVRSRTGGMFNGKGGNSPQQMTSGLGYDRVIL